MTCPACAAPTTAGARFCAQCGTRLPVACEQCGAVAPDGARFCPDCGAALSAAPQSAPPPASAGPAVTPPPPVAERRLVSVLFADLVGFTQLSESRDAEEVRELLSGYFDVCRSVVARHGGVVEKFIGDAVFAVWGAPVANEDDAERAVRTALELVTAVQAMGEDVLAPGLRLRAGVLTGEAAVNLRATGEGMVAGDLVNTASRIQSVAEPGTVLVGDTTRRATDSTVRYEPAGLHELKGKAEPMALYRALQVVAGRSGFPRVEGLEAPFVGRDRELRMLKDLFHTSVDHRSPQLVTITGIAGVGKSRLSWEFEKYVDGLADNVLWHLGRCLAYGEGVTYSALADMVRGRIRATEEDSPDGVAAKLADTMTRYVPDKSERRWIEPRLRQLIGLQDDRVGTSRDDQFAAWRLFFERLAAEAPVVLVFEDLQWADSALVDFVDHLLEWSRGNPIYVLALSRPELMERHATWGAGRRNFTSVHLEPLAAEAMSRLLGGLVPGLPPSVTSTIRSRAEGVPLYAVETVRMLLDQGLLRQVGDGYQPTGPIDDLRVPETLHGLIAARLDGLPPGDRQLVEDASVLGKCFTASALAGVSGRPAAALDGSLAHLVSREIVVTTKDPMSSDRGRYEFVQDLLRRVAYETLSRHDRRAKHLAAADALLAAGDEDVEVVAAHYVEAMRAVPEAPDNDRTREAARSMLHRAGERAEKLAAPSEALRYWIQALELTDDPDERALLEERAGTAASTSGRQELARDLLVRAMATHEDAGRVHAAARVSARLAEVDFGEGRLTAAVERMERALEVLSDDTVDADIAMVSAQLARHLFFAGRAADAVPHVEVALSAAERMDLTEVLSQSLNTKSLLLLSQERPTEGEALLRTALRVALEGDLHSAALRAYFNLAEQLGDTGRIEEALELYRTGLAHAQRVGDKFFDQAMQAGVVQMQLVLGEWDEALQSAWAIAGDEDIATLQLMVFDLAPAVGALVARGDLEGARTFLGRMRIAVDSENVQNRAAHLSMQAAVARAEGRAEDALLAGRASMQHFDVLGMVARAPADGFVEAMEAAFELGDDEAIDEMLALADSRPHREALPYFAAQRARFAARRQARRGDDRAAVAGFEAALTGFEFISHAYGRAITLVDLAEHHLRCGRPESAGGLLVDARRTLEQLAARPALDRLDRVAAMDEGSEVATV